MSTRIERVNHLLQKEIAFVMRNYLKENIGFVSIVEVRTSRDLSVSRVYYSVLGDKRQKDKVARILKNASGFIRKMVGERVRLKFLPSLDFIMDESIEYGFHMEEVFRRLHEHEEDKRGNRE